MIQVSKGRPEIIAIASGKGGTGKTLIGACLGYALTFSGHRVLMVDTDTATHGLSLFLLGPKGPRLIFQFPEEHTWTGALKSAHSDPLLRNLPVPRQIRRDLTGETDHGVKYEGVVSGLGVYGDERWIEPAFYPNRPEFRKIFQEFLTQLRSEGEYDYVLIDTRGGFSFESTDACALSDSFIVVTEADLTSFYQDRNLIRLVNSAAGELGTKPLLRSILVNRATEGNEETFRLALEREFPPIKFDETHAIPLDIEALKAYKVQQMPYVTAPGSHFSYATLEAFRDILSVVTAEWSDDRVKRWNELVERVSNAIEQKNRKFEQERTEEEKLRRESNGMLVVLDQQKQRIEFLERELQRAEESHRREIQRVERLQSSMPPPTVALSSPLKRWLPWSITTVFVLILTALTWLQFRESRREEMRQHTEALLQNIYNRGLPNALRVRALQEAIQNGEKSFKEINLSRADLSGLKASAISLRFANLIEANLSGASLGATDLSYTKLNRAVLRDADLSFAVLEGADLREADLRGANLFNAELSHAQLEGAKVTRQQLSEAHNAPRSRAVSIGPVEPVVSIKVVGWISTEGQRTPVDDLVEYNFTLPAEARITNFRLTITQVVNGKDCASADIEPGNLNFPKGTTMDTVPEFRDQFQAGCGVKGESSIECFVDPKKPALCEG